MAIHDRSNGWEIMEEEARMKDKGFLYNLIMILKKWKDYLYNDISYYRGHYAYLTAKEAFELAYFIQIGELPRITGKR